MVKPTKKDPNADMPKVETTYLGDLFWRYMRANQIKIDAIADKMGCTKANVSTKLQRPDRLWRSGEISEFCALTACPIEMAIREQQHYFEASGR